MHPRLVIRCGSVADVALGIGYARDTGIAIARAEGVTASRVGRPPTGSCSTLAGLDSISVADDGLATIGAGACLARVYAALHVHGRTIPAGCGATVGIAGLTLGGGIGLLGRKHGLTCDRLVGARVVLADGRIVDCDADREPELFWALRGAGGGQFGVVTSLDDWATAYHAGNHPGWQRPRRPTTPTDCSSSRNPSDPKPLEESCLV